VNRYLKLLLAIIICEGVGFIGSIFTVNSIDTWYIVLQKPFFNPPPWIFAPVWAVLYLLMGISLYLVWEIKKVHLKWFWIQLFLNVFWSIIFFGFRNPSLAFLEILFLWISIAITIKSFIGFNKNAAYLLFPYFSWVSFAVILNLAIVLLNK